MWAADAVLHGAMITRGGGVVRRHIDRTGVAMERTFGRISGRVVGLGVVAAAMSLAACSGDGGNGRSNDGRDSDRGVRPATGEPHSAEGRGVEYLKRQPNAGADAGPDARPDADRPSDSGGIRRAE
jgi:hypothetical protein